MEERLIFWIFLSMLALALAIRAFISYDHAVYLYGRKTATSDTICETFFSVLMIGLFVVMWYLSSLLQRSVLEGVLLILTTILLIVLLIYLGLFAWRHITRGTILLNLGRNEYADLVVIGAAVWVLYAPTKLLSENIVSRLSGVSGLCVALIIVVVNRSPIAMTEYGILNGIEVVKWKDIKDYHFFKHKQLILRLKVHRKILWPKEMRICIPDLQEEAVRSLLQQKAPGLKTS